ncbi:MAG: integration host factor subunit beta [Candidatus Omnitrophota bacterium]|nr:MAG: integration host factor subunit beta [Candidatus Omnitrophota bacterium]
MTKKEIVAGIADRTDMKQIEVKKVVQLALDIIVDSLSKGETVELRNFGIFKVKSRKARLGRNPKTGESVRIPEKKAVTFKAGLVMKDRVR